MIARPYRLRTAADFNKTYQRGRSINADAMYIKHYQSHLANSKVAVVVSKKVSKKAVVRNRCKRRVIEVVRKSWQHVLPGHNLIITIKQDISKLPAPEVEAIVVDIIKRAKLWQSSTH